MIIYHQLIVMIAHCLVLEVSMRALTVFILQRAENAKVNQEMGVGVFSLLIVAK